MEERWPWETDDHLRPVDPWVYQTIEESLKDQLPHVIKPLPVQGTVMGSSSPHQTGDIVCYDILKRAPLYDLTSHFSDIKPKAPVRGSHRHISAPTLLPGRRSQAVIPAPMKAHPVSGPKTVISSRWWPPSDASASASGTPPATKPTAPSAISARLRLVIAAPL